MSREANLKRLLVGVKSVIRGQKLVLSGRNVLEDLIFRSVTIFQFSLKSCASVFQVLYLLLVGCDFGRFRLTADWRGRGGVALRGSAECR